jgi:predicted MFS family arabinose efflux permease
VRIRHLLIAVAAGLALADASIVTLALPDILVDLHTTVDGVAAVIGIYTVVLVVTLIPVERLMRRIGPAHTGAAGLALFAAASLGCAAANSLTVLLIARAIQALGGSAALMAAFSLLVAKRDARQLWLYATVVASAVGPALGGALTQAFDWRAIFVFQAPIGALAAVACLLERDVVLPPRVKREPFPVVPAAALAMLSAALSAVLFLLVLMLVAGWSEAPLRAAAAVTVIPAGALVGSRIKGRYEQLAAAGCLLVGGGVIALALLPEPKLVWTLIPQALAGVGMGMALPSLAGGLLPERDSADAASLLTLRHLGIAVILAILAPLASHNLNTATERARERGVALVLDAPLDPLEKIKLAPALLKGVDTTQDPRAGLRKAVAAHRTDVSEDERTTYDKLGKRADETLTDAVAEAFRPAFIVTGVLALIAALLLLLPPPWLALGAATATIAGYALLHATIAPEPVKIQDPCKPRNVPSAGGITGFLQGQALKLLDSTACRLHASREELVLALADEQDRKRFQEKYGVDVRSLSSVLGSLISG